MRKPGAEWSDRPDQSDSSDSSLKLSVLVGSLLRRQGLTLATAESCTGGFIGNLVTDVPGSSDYYVGGIIAYSNNTKTRLLGVKVATLRRSGAVSSAVVKEMAHGVRVRLRADVGIAVSGIAGPAGGTKKKPTGLVYVGLASDNHVCSQKFRFSGSRREVKEQAAAAALGLCRRALES